MDVNGSLLPDSEDKTSLGIPHLKRLWHRHQMSKMGELDPELNQSEWPLDTVLIDELQLGIENTLINLYRFSNLEEFEGFVLHKNAGSVSENQVQRIEQAVHSFNEKNKKSHEYIEPVLSDEQMTFWNENGYLVIPSVLDEDECSELLEEIEHFLNVSLQNPDSWYEDHYSKQHIMVQFFDSQVQKRVRKKENIHKAFAQLWQTNDLVVTTDRVSLNPPETDYWKFPGPRMHWDMIHFNPPIPFCTQGLIYLTDTAENQGAFCCVPGFHLKIDDWLETLPKGQDPQVQDWDTFNVKPIAAKAGDLIIWHHALPHGSSPNSAQSPRVVQYLNMYPLKQ